MSPEIHIPDGGLADVKGKGQEIGEYNKITKSDFSDEILRAGHSIEYRGKHRSQVKGAGIMAFFRSLWMERYHK